jgi:hypothetical protein
MWRLCLIRLKLSTDSWSALTASWGLIADFDSSATKADWLEVALDKTKIGICPTYCLVQVIQPPRNLLLIAEGTRRLDAS